MKVIKKINCINFVIVLILSIIALIINYLLYFNKNSFIVSCFMLSFIGLINMVFVCIKEAKVLTYDSKRYTLVLHVTHIILGGVLQYIVRYVNCYYELKYFIWFVFVLMIIIPILVVKVLNDKTTTTSNDGPKFIMNR